MAKVLLALASGQQSEKELITSFINDGVQYIIFDGESTGSMGLPIILVGKDNYGKVVGITDAEEWKLAKNCLKKIISGEQVEYAYVPSQLNADDIYYRQLTLPIASFDLLKNSYVAPEAPNSSQVTASDNTPIFEPIQPEDIINSVSSQTGVGETPIFNEPATNAAPVTSEQINNNSVSIPGFEAFTPEYNNNQSNLNSNTIDNPSVDTNSTNAALNNNQNNYEELKREFMASAEKLFDDLYKKFNHID